MKIWFSILLLLLVIPGFTQSDVSRNKEFNLDEGVATSADMEIFQANPFKYEPQYRGWCAYAIGKEGSKVEVDPESFKIIDGSLFLIRMRSVFMRRQM